MIYTSIESENNYGTNQVTGIPHSFIESKLEIAGENNRIVFGENFKGKELHIYIAGNNSAIIFGSHCDIRAKICVYNNANIIIGNKFRTTKIINLTALHNKTITIGDNCLFSNVVVETTDHYALLDLHNQAQLNHDENITIGDRVWCARDVILEKGTHLGNNVVVAARSIVNSTFGNNIVIAGNPAKVVKENIIWDECTEIKNIPAERLAEMS